jgi:hypothetical protein
VTADQGTRGDGDGVVFGREPSRPRPPAQESGREPDPDAGPEAEPDTDPVIEAELIEAELVEEDDRVPVETLEADEIVVLPVADDEDEDELDEEEIDLRDVDAEDDVDTADGEDLLATGAADALRERWVGVQAAFADEPRRAVEAADGLVAEAIAEVERRLAAEREVLGAAWRSGDPSTDDLLDLFLRYRAVFERLLAAGPVTPSR